MRRGLWASSAIVVAAGLLAPVWVSPAAAQTPTVDYDLDDDGLIEVSSLAHLNAIRWDLDGDGTADVYPPAKDGYTGHDPDGAAKHAAAFPDAAAGMGCPSTGCIGYELAASLDFDTNGNGEADVGDDYWNGGKGWDPLMGGEAVDSSAAYIRFVDKVGSSYAGDRPNPRARMYTAVFEGNGRTIANLHIDDSSRQYVGLFGYIGPGAHVRNFGLTASHSDSGVRGGSYTGALTGGVERGRVSGVYSHLDVFGGGIVGGLVGEVWRLGSVIESYATGDVHGTSYVGGLAGMLNASGAAASYATGDVTLSDTVGGGLVGYRPDGHLRATYATGSVHTSKSAVYEFSGVQHPRVGGLIGWLTHPSKTVWPRANYAVGQVSGPQGSVEGGLTGGCFNSKRPFDEGSNYWDVEASGLATSPECGVGYTTAQLQTPTGYTGIYADWNVDVDIAGYFGPFDGPDDPWDFGTSTQYPVLKYCAAKPGIDTADGQPYCPLDTALQRTASLVDPNDDDDGTTDVKDTTDDKVTPPEPPLVKYAALIKSFHDRISDNNQHGDSAAGGWNKRFLKAMGHPEYVNYPQDAVTVARAQELYDHGGPGANTAWAGTVEALEYKIAYDAGQTTIDPVSPPPPDPDPEISISAGAGVTEGTAASFTLNASPAPTSALTVKVNITAAGSYGVTTGVRNVSVPTSGSVSITVDTTGDEVDEVDGSVTATVQAGTGYTVDSTAGDATVQVFDDDPTVTAPVVDDQSDPLVKFAAVIKAFYDRISDNNQHGDSAAGGWNKRFLKAMGHPEYVSYPQDAVTVARAQELYDHGGPGANTAWEGTVEALEYKIAYDAGQVTVDPVIPPPPEPDPEITISAGAGVTEGADASFTLNASPAPTTALTVKVNITAAGSYGVTTGVRNVSVPTSGAVTFTVPTTGDSVDEPDGSATATVQSGSGYTVGTPSTGTVAIADNDDPPLPPPDPDPEITISADADVTEGFAASFTVTASPAPTTALTVKVNITAVGSYGVTTGVRNISVPTSGTVTFTVPTTDDDVDEPDGSATATVQSGSGYTVGTPSAGTVAIADDDPPPVVDPKIGLVARVEQLRDDYSAYEDWATGSWHQYMVHYSSGEVLALLNSDSPVANSISNRALFFRAVRAANGAGDNDAAALFGEVRDHFGVKKIG